MNLTNMVFLDFRTRSAREVVAGTGIMRSSCVVRILEIEPDGLFRQQVVDAVLLDRVPFKEVVIEVVQVPIEIVIWREKEAERNELVGQRVENV